MNWKEIKKKHPKSIKLLKEWLYLKPGDEGDLGLNMISKLLHTERRLYDFFDEQEIYIHIYNTEKTKFYWEIEEGDAESETFFNSRCEAEEIAFLKAFEILEK